MAMAVNVNEVATPLDGNFACYGAAPKDPRLVCGVGHISLPQPWLLRITISVPLLARKRRFLNTKLGRNVDVKLWSRR